jgi:hypothetical protein
MYQAVNRKVISVGASNRFQGSLQTCVVVEVETASQGCDAPTPAYKPPRSSSLECEKRPKPRKVPKFDSARVVVAQHDVTRMPAAYQATQTSAPAVRIRCANEMRYTITLCVAESKSTRLFWLCNFWITGGDSFHEHYEHSAAETMILDTGSKGECCAGGGGIEVITNHP